MKKSFNTNEIRTEFPRGEVRAAISQGIQQAEQQGDLQNTPLQVKRRKRKPLLYIASTAAACGLIIGSAFVSPTLASSLSQLPIIGSVFSDSGLLGLKQASDQGLTSAVGETQTNNEISVTINEVLYDSTNITVGFTIESQEELSEEYFRGFIDFTINGNSPVTGSGSYGEKIISPTARTGIATFGVTDDMPETFELGLVLESVEGEKWNFSTPIKKITDIVRVPVDHQQQVDGVKLDVSELSLSPSGVGISFVASEKGSMPEMMRASYVEFRITDEYGREITSHSGGLRGQLYDDVWVFSGKKSFDPITKDIKELTITPFLSLPTGGSGVAIDENGNETIIHENRSSLKEVEFKPFTVNIN
ncbi:DUF4179 domain-containing protein [Lysinibacillus sp. NPDC096418]|uniref:DUF4179 domain-containing protein n=1 Tax=Lysinibacillus sp. NPDC096418 TaxID=3364138 RepID=UPI003801CF76